MPSPPAKFTKQVYVSLTPTVFGALTEIAESEGVSVSSLLRQAADQYLNTLRQQKGQPTVETTRLPTAHAYGA